MMLKNIGQYRQSKSDRFYMPKWCWKISDNIGNPNQIDSKCPNDAEKYWTISAIKIKSILNAEMLQKILGNIGNQSQTFPNDLKCIKNILAISAMKIFHHKSKSKYYKIYTQYRQSNFFIIIMFRPS